MRLLAIAGLVFVAACDQSGSETAPAGSGFDFYVLALSWSPSYCEAEGERANKQQCGGERQYGFVVHGLWPQFEKGYPQFCIEDPQKVEVRIEDGFLDIMPSRALIRHQWKKHGTCAGLSQTHYFDTIRTAHGRVNLPVIMPQDGKYRTVSPDEIEEAFLESNPKLDKKHFAVTCDRRRLREVRICMTADLEYRSCPEITRRSCKRPSIVIPPSRGS
ncbi:ribonuclease [Hoeflea sp. TYP-13]|uniref:ribonuclease T2 family protein n=1 Tax=Hoeflea sp. TYP-13 TaxID=3230023 RepID=UPI0034C5E59D